MNIYSVHFGNSKLYERFARVLAYSVHKHSPNTPLTIHRVSKTNEEIISSKRKGATGHDVINALKTKYHNQVIQNADNGAFVCMMDLDICVFGDLSEAEGNYDLGYTVRNQRAKINSGIIFVRVSEKTKEWYQRWYDIVCNLLDDTNHLRKLKQTYSGINQSALGVMLEQPHDLILKEFPAKIWNCTPIHYRDFNLNTKVVHLLNNGNALKHGGKDRGILVAQAWLELEKESDSELLSRRCNR